jgi:phosphoribosylformimino-5-aminoimidazole carboxamide ribotide isomerase
MTGPDRHPFELLPAIDIRGGRVVRLAEGDFARETVYESDPDEVAQLFATLGAKWIHVVDLDGARDATQRQLETIARVLRIVGESVACEVAGGLRDEESVAEVLELGAARAVVGTAALRDPGFAGRLVERFGPDRIAAALDVRDGLAVGHGWTPGAPGVPVDEALGLLADQGIRTFVVTALARDGMMSGPDVELLGRMVRLGRGEVIASAGISSLGDILSVKALGCSGAVIGKAIYEGYIDLPNAMRLVTEEWTPEEPD